MATRYLYLALLTSTALIGLGSAAFAQSAKTDDTTTDKKPAASAASTYLSPLTVGLAAVGGVGDPYATTAAVASVSKEEIDQFGGSNIDNVLRTQPGVFTRDNMQNTGVAVNIRGLEGSGRVTMMVDGARQGFRFTTHEAQGFTYVDPALLAGIDVERGAAGGAAGSGSLAGSANFRTLAVDDLLADGKDYGGYGTITAGNNGAGYAPSGATAFRINDTFAMLGALSVRHQGDYNNALGQTVPFTAQDIVSGLGKIEITPTLDQKLVLSGVIYRGDFVANSYAQTVTNQTYTANYDYVPADNPMVDLHANLYLNDTDMLYGKAPSIPSGGSAQGRHINDLGLGVSVENTSRGDIGGTSLSATYGLTYSGDDVDVKNNTLSSASGVNPSGTSTLAGVFASVTASVGVVDLTGGLRYDHFTADGSASALPGNSLGLPVGTFPVDRSTGRLSPSAKIAITSLGNITPYLSYAETFRPPTINELMTGGDHPSGATLGFSPNPSLAPEVARTWELGANFVKDGVFTNDDSFKLKADVFMSSIDDYITAQFAPDGTVYFGNNPGISTVKGLEVQAGYDAGVVFGSLAYTYTTTDLPSQINGFGAQSYLPDHIFTTTLGTRLLEDHSLTIGTRIYAVSDSYIGTINAAPGQSPYQPGYSLVDLFANWKLENGIELGANVSNLFNVAYSPALSTTPTTTGMTGRGRTIEITAKARF